MNLLADDAYADALACWLCTFAVHGLVLGGAGLAVCVCLRGRALAWQEVVLRTCLGAPLATSLAQWWWLEGPLLHLPAIAAVASAGPADLPASRPWPATGALLPPGPQAAPLPRPVAPTVWPPAPGSLVVVLAAGLALAGLARLARGRRQLGALLRARAPETDPRIVRCAAEVARALGLRRTPLLRRCPGLLAPLVCGSARAEICLPERAGELGDEELAALLGHELAHVRRRDAAWLWAGALLQALFPWQLPWLLLRRRLLWVAELRCDAEASRCSSPVALAQCLVEVAGWFRPRQALPEFAAGMAARPSALRQRVEAALAGSAPDRVPREVAWLLPLALLAIGTAAVPGLRARAAAPPAPGAPGLAALRAERDALLAEAMQVLHDARREPEDETMQRLRILLEDRLAAMMRANDRLEAALARRLRRGPDGPARRMR